MDRTDLFDVIDEAFGRRRWLQHSPISPDVWEAFLEDDGRGLDPKRRCDVLFTAATGSEPGLIARALRTAIQAIPDSVSQPEIAANANSVVARLTLQELVCAAAPLTAWWQSLPEELRTIGSLKAAIKDPTLEFDTSDKVEFFSFAATAGLVHLLINDRAPDLYTARRDGTQSDKVRSERSARSAKTIVKPAILEMLSAFDALFPNVEYNLDAPPKTAVDHVHSNRKSQLAVAFSRRTIKADASENLFQASTAGITWAGVDSGIDATHPAFACTTPAIAPDTFSSRVYETYDFARIRQILSDPDWEPAIGGLQDRLDQGLAVDWSLLRDHLRIKHDADYPPPKQEHGTHVAGIIGAKWNDGPAPQPIHGMCPDIRLLDIRVFDDNGATDEFTILSALQFLSYLNSLSTAPMVHGANMSFSLVHKVRSFACGRTPICDACDRLVKDGIVVVAAAGNAGFNGDSAHPTLNDRYVTVSITDPGNADAAITVGSTHKISPVSYGVSYFSSRGPTGDGRSKPDILAPGEKIVSTLPGGRYGERDGTSQAAPHVSGAAAILLARYSELIGRPQLVKQILCDSATDLGRERAFQGAGLVDVLRALQSSWRDS